MNFHFLVFFLLYSARLCCFRQKQIQQIYDLSILFHDFFFFSRFNMLIISLEVKYTISSCYGSCGSTVNTTVFLPPIERIWILDLNPSSTIYFKKEFQMIHNSVINFEFNSKGHRLLMNFTL